MTGAEQTLKVLLLCTVAIAVAIAATDVESTLSYFDAWQPWCVEGAELFLPPGAEEAATPSARPTPLLLLVPAAHCHVERTFSGRSTQGCQQQRPGVRPAARGRGLCQNSSHETQHQELYHQKYSSSSD
jgi:hypothetical protein